MVRKNPLLASTFLIPFQELAPRHLLEAARITIREARTARKDLLMRGGSARALLHHLEDTRLALERIARVAEHLEAVASTPELRRVNEKLLPLLQRFESSWKSSPRLYGILEKRWEKGEDPYWERLRFRTLEEMEREGAKLPRAKREELRRVSELLLLKTTQFARNALDATHAFELILEERERLEGIPPLILEICARRAREKGKRGWLLSLDPPVYLAVLMYARDRALREALYRAQVTRASAPPYDNRPLIVEILALRQKKANLLGYRHFAELVLAPRMAKSPEEALRFLEELVARAQPYFLKETEELKAFFAAQTGEPPHALKPWDLLFYAERLREERFSLSHEELRPYFPLPRVLAGLFQIAARLFGLTLKEVPPHHPEFPQVWHPEVRFFQVYDEKGTFRGGFYLDLHPRKQKRSGAWMNGLVTGGPSPGGGFLPHLAVVCANLTPQGDGTPPLLTFEEVQTLFHEFGHLLHHLLSDVPVRSLGGTRVVWDFVELPSQLLENWCFEPEAIPLFSGHWQRGEPLPEPYLRALIGLRRFRAASELMRQCSYAILDLRLHSDYDPARQGDPLTFSRKLLSRFSPVPLPEDYAMICSFHHLFDDPVGYAAGYYSYKWAEVLEADLFSRFHKEGIFNPTLGQELREKILSRGDSEDPAQLFRAFMGRDPDPGALLTRLFGEERAPVLTSTWQGQRES